MKEYKSFSELKEEFGDNYDFKADKMEISMIEEIDELEETLKYYKNKASRLQQENKKLKANWNKLKERLKKEGIEINTREYGTFDAISKDVIFEIM